jgi:hypothetical protein
MGDFKLELVAGTHSECLNYSQQNDMLEITSMSGDLFENSLDRLSRHQYGVDNMNYTIISGNIWGYYG